MAPTLGDYELEQIVGRGGMAVVWRAVHRQHRTPVALKVMSRRSADEPMRSALREEVRAAARLTHPGIVAVLDVAAVDPASEAVAEGLVDPEGDYFVMEYIDGPTLSEHQAALDWPQVRGLLLHLLDALAHAHARNVIHRDLKPSNILLERTLTGLRPKISDFGIARVLSSDTTRRSSFDTRVTGTPKYMAPEQVEGRWRDHGPWTDLYALGCLAYALIAGHPPFVGKTALEILKQQVHSPVPALDADAAVPDGFICWLATMLAKSPHRRFRCAADAAYALLRLEPLEADAPVYPNALGAAENLETEAYSYTSDSTLVLGQGDWVVDPQTAELDRDRNADEFPKPPIPRAWAQGTDAMSQPRFIRAGLNLFDLRPIPMVDRDRERKAMWDALRAVARERRPRCVLIRGATGTGKSRVVEWLAERAAEVGAAEVLRAAHGAIAGQRDGLGGMVGRYLTCFGLSRREGVERIRKWYGGDGSLDSEQLYDCFTLADMMGLEDEREHSSPIRSTPIERRETLRRFIAQVATKRAVIVWLDDVHWGREACEFALYLCQAQPEIAALVVCTVQEEALTMKPVEAGAIARLAEHPRCLDLELGPLTPEDHRELVSRMAGLDEALAGQIAQRTDGNPLFAVQLVGDCIERGILVPSATGFTLAPGAMPELSDGLRDILLRRVAQVVEQLPPPAREDGWIALELAAALGSEVVDSEWRKVCSQAKLGVPAGLLERLSSTRLVRREENAWRFTHAMLRECLERRAEQHGRRRDHHRLCAETIASLPGADGPRVLMRRSQHHMEAGDWELALGPLLAAAKIAIDAMDTRLGSEALNLYDLAFEKTDLPPHHAGRIEALIQRAYALTLYKGPAAARKLAAESLRLARTADDPYLLGRAHWILGVICLIESSIEEAITHHEKTIEHHRAEGDLLNLGKVLAYAAYAHIYQGNLEQALAYGRESIELLEQVDDPTVLATAHRMFAEVLARHRRFDDARRACLRSLSEARRAGNRYSIGDAFRILACVERRAGRGDAVRRNVERARKIYEKNAHYVALWGLTLQLALIDYQQGDHVSARDGLERVVAVAEPTFVEAAAARFALAGIAATNARRDVWHEQVAAAQPALDTGKIDDDIASYAERAGNLAYEAGWPEEARAAWRIAHQHWRALRREREAARVRAALESTVTA